MRKLILAGVLFLASACGGSNDGSASATVAQVLDGDTIVLADGRHVRLVQLDAPEEDDGECYGSEAERVLAGLVPPGTEVEIETDPALDQRDRFGRVLAYARRDGANVNLELVRRGAASVWFYEGDRGRYAPELLAAAREAKAHARGLWAACPGTVLDPLHAVEAKR